MKPEDYLLGAVNCWFIATLVPTLLGRSRVRKFTCYGTSVGLVVGTVSDVRLGLYIAATTTALIALGWLVVGLRLRTTST